MVVALHTITDELNQQPTSATARQRRLRETLSSTFQAALEPFSCGHLNAANASGPCQHCYPRAQVLERLANHQTSWACADNAHRNQGRIHVAHAARRRGHLSFCLSAYFAAALWQQERSLGTELLETPSEAALARSYDNANQNSAPARPSLHRRASPSLLRPAVPCGSQHVAQRALSRLPPQLLLKPADNPAKGHARASLPHRAQLLQGGTSKATRACPTQRSQRCRRDPSTSGMAYSHWRRCRHCHMVQARR